MLGYLGIFITHERERERTRERVDRCLCECRCVASVAVKHFVLQPNAENRALYKKGSFFVVVGVFVLFGYYCYDYSVPILLPRREFGDVRCLLPVWNLRAVI